MRFFLFVVLISLISSCSSDNYTMPDAEILGSFVNAETGDTVYTSGNKQGTLITLLEGNSHQGLTFFGKPDGTFQNSAEFNGKYKLTASGPFKFATGDTVDFELNEQIDLTLNVVPYVSLELNQKSNSNGIGHFELKYSKSFSDSKLSDLGITWSTYPFPNNNLSFGGGVLQASGFDPNSDQGEESFDITIPQEGNVIYVRGFALVENAGSYYNYSQQIVVRK